jgi:hypothetical protein
VGRGSRTIQDVIEENRDEVLDNLVGPERAPSRSLARTTARRAFSTNAPLVVPRLFDERRRRSFGRLAPPKTLLAPCLLRT